MSSSACVSGTIERWRSGSWDRAACPSRPAAPVISTFIAAYVANVASGEDAQPQFVANSLKPRGELVLFGKDRVGNRPGDVELRIVPGDGALAIRVVELGAFVNDDSFLRRHLVSMCETGWNVDRVTGRG